ncbi:MAG TPA: pantoate--beta-alanine ligase [Acidimicrobiia bacterium]|nr:pantoate--beta-alanine ligase [Acidimicrobiia bacterium]HLF60171.1 pantoate--beta-alanine ligase [Acidimicrobiia bacterium]
MDLTTTFAGTRGLYTGTVGLLPTLGYFHEGHLKLMELLRGQCDTLVVSVFVNPTQFNDSSDFDSYPRDFERDTGLASEHAVDILFFPEHDEVYPTGWTTIVEVGGVSQEMEGRHRAGHFTGVATVVAKLFAGLQPDLAMFGRKDAQQLAVLEAMTRDLRFPIQIIHAPLIREPDGFALSSRNVRLGRVDRERALALSRGLFQAAEQIDAGERRAERLEATVRRSVRDLEIDYVMLASQDTMTRIETLDQPAVLAAAVKVGEVRLIDNIAIDVAEGRFVPDRGLILDEASRLGTLR